MADYGIGGDGAGEIPQEYTEEAVVEFLKARQERIGVRRARIGIRIAMLNEVEKDGSDASSLDGGAGDDGRPGTTGSGQKSGSGPGSRTSRGKLRSGDGHGGAGTGGSGGDGGAELLNIKRNTADPLDSQIDESRKQLEEIILDGEALITNVRIAAENREKVRHIKQSESRKERLERLTAEAEECQKMYDDMKPNWNITGEKTLPLDLFNQIKDQMMASEELLMKKQDLITSLQQEVEDNDFEYELSLELYQKDVSLLGDRIDDCVDNLQSSFLSELNLIEDYTCRNREAMLEENQQEWMGLLGEFEKMEEGHLEDRKKDALDKFKNLNELYIQVKQECRAMRHRFEDDLRILIQELEQIKYATQLNMEKLQYNLAIVKKRYKENVEMMNMMKRLLLKFNDRFTTKSRALKEKMEAGKKESKKILADIAKLEESLSQAGKKTLHLAMSDWAKYMDMWMVSEELVREKVKKLLDSERFIFETQLGFSNAIIPEISFMDERPESVSKYVNKKSATYAELLQQNKRGSRSASSSEKKPSRPVDTPKDEDSTLEEVTDSRLDSCQKSASLLLLPSDSMEFIPGPEPDPAIQRRLMRHVAKIICDESGFLVEEELRRLLEPLVETERNLVNLDALLKALGINSVQEMQYLAHFMLRRCRVTKGVISRIGSNESAHLSEMNVSLEGIVGKNAMDDLDSDGASTTQSKSVSPHLLSEGPIVSGDGASHETSEFQECQCDVRQSWAVDALTKKEKLEKEPKVMGETSLEILLPPVAREGSPGDEDGTCALLQELKGIEERPLDFSDFAHIPQTCTPRCCSLAASEDTIEEAVVEVVDDDELEQMLNTAEEEGEEEGDDDLQRSASKCSTCGGVPHDHQDCSFYSIDATVLSWADPDSPPNRELKEALQGVEVKASEEIIPLSSLPSQLLEVVATVQDPVLSVAASTVVSASTTVSPEKLGSNAAVEEVEIDPVLPLTVEGYGDPVRRYSEVRPPPIVPPELGGGDKSSPPTADTEPLFTKSDSVDSDSQDTASIESIGSSSNGSTEFMYIDSDEVIEALTEFCKDYNAKITIELPTVDEIIDRKLTAFKYPKQSMVMEYWERPVSILTSNSDDLWDTMQYCFEQFCGALTKRNAMVDRFIGLYKQNQELGMLMKNHLAAANKYSSSRPNPNPGYMHYGRFCGK